MQNLSKAGIDPHLFDLMLSNELDRRLKAQFGAFFFVATVGTYRDAQGRPIK
jgi:hypothetical protein